MGIEHPHGVELIVAYDGTEFAGWQHQPGQRTVEGVLRDAVTEMGGGCSRLRGASRTDAGVHALGQVVGVATTRRIPPRGWVSGLNGALPPDVAVRRAREVEPGYDPRRHATGKHYRYVARVGPTRDPLSRRHALQIGPSGARPARRVPRGEALEEWLDVTAMRRAARHLLGTHDFAAFKASNDPRDNTVRTLRRLDVVPGFGADPATVAIEVEGDAFLKNMVRILAGTLLEVGRERFTPERVGELVGAGAERPDAGPTAPAHGLCLVEVFLGR